MTNCPDVAASVKAHSLMFILGQKLNVAFGAPIDIALYRDQNK
jgi:hypothetical protein